MLVYICGLLNNYLGVVYAYTENMKNNVDFNFPQQEIYIQTKI